MNAPEELSYEQARTQLEEIVRQLESSGTNLAEMMELWERGEALARICQEYLDAAKATIDASRPEPPAQ